MNITLVTAAVFFAAFLGNRFIMTNAMKKLDDATKLKFIEAFSRRNNYSTIILVAVIFIYFWAVQSFPQQNLAISVIYLGAYLTYATVKSLLDYGKLKQIGTPAGYIKSYVLASLIFIVGVLSIAGIYAAGILGLFR